MPVTGTSMRYTFDAAPTRRRRKAVQYFEMMGHRAHLRRRLEGGHPPPAGRAVRRRRLGAVPPRRGPLGVPRPRRRAARARLAELVDLWWAEAEEHGVLPARRPHHRAVRRPLPRPLAAPAPSRHYTYRPPMSPLPGQVGAGDRRAQLGPRRHHRPAGRRRRRALRHRHRELRASACSSRTTAWCFDYNCFGDHHVVESERAGARSAPSVVGVRFRAHRRAAGDGHPRDRRRAVRAGRHPVRHAHDLEHRAERRLRPRLAGQRPLPRPVPVRGGLDRRFDVTLARRSSLRPGTPRPRRPNGRRCPASDGGGSSTPGT